jgi:outer membrane lipoprotein carrier protein
MKGEIGKQFLASLALMALPVLVRAEANLPLDQVVDKVQANYDQARTYSASFRQEIVSPSFGQAISSGKGEILYQKPGKMVWRYREPEAHVYVLSGNTLWDYYPAEKQAIHLTLDQALIENVPKSFLFGMGKLREQFELSFHAGRPVEEDGSIKLDLAPKSETARNALGILVFTVAPKTFLVQEVEMTDSLGNLNHLWFENIRLNPTLDSKQFAWTPPKGVKVLSADNPKAPSGEKEAKPKLAPPPAPTAPSPAPAPVPAPASPAPGGTHP